MFTVRFSTGVSVTYNDANFLRYVTNGRELYTTNPDRGGIWVATVPNDCIVEAVRACRVENPVEQLTADHALDYVVTNLRSYNGMHRSRIRKLKHELVSFKYGHWTE